MDPNGVGQGATGFAWFVDLNDSNGVLASGVINEGGGDTGPLSLTGVAANAGDHINFVVDPNDNPITNQIWTCAYALSPAQPDPANPDQWLPSEDLVPGPTQRGACFNLVMSKGDYGSIGRCLLKAETGLEKPTPCPSQEGNTITRRSWS